MSYVAWAPAAERDLEEIAYYIARVDNRPMTADRVVNEIVAKCETYDSSPGLGTAIPQLGANHRYFVHKRWVVIYRGIDGGIEVLRIVDSARDFPSMFPPSQP